MSILQNTSGILTGATNILLGTSFRAPTLGAAKKGTKRGTKKGTKKDPPDNSEEALSKKELAEISGILSDIQKSLTTYLKASAIAPKMLLEMQAERKKSADFLGGMVAGMRAEMLESGQDGNESLNAFLDGFSESIREFVESSALLPRLGESTEELSESIRLLTEQADQGPESKLAENEHQREQEQVEEKRHNKLISTLASLATLGFLHSKSKNKDGTETSKSSFLGGLMGGMLGKGAIAGLLLAFGKFALIAVGIGLIIAGLVGAFKFIKLMITDPKKFKELFGDPEYWKEKLMGALSWVGETIWGAIEWLGNGFNAMGRKALGWLIDKVRGLFGVGEDGDGIKIVEEMGAKINEFFASISELFSWEKIKESFATAWAITKNKFNEIKESFVAKYEEIKESIVSIFNSIKESISNTITSIQDGVQKIIDGVVDKFDEIKEKIIGIYTSIVEGIGAKIDEMKEGFDSLKASFTEKFNEFMANLTGFFDPEMWKQKAIEKFDAAKEGIGTLYDESMEKIQGFIGDATKGITEFFTGIEETIKAVFEDIVKLVKALKDSIIALGKSLFSKDPENEADTNIKIIDEEDENLKERIRVLGRTTRASPKVSEEKKQQIEEYEVQREELKKARDKQESQHKKSLNNIDAQIEKATGQEKEELIVQRKRIVDAAKQDAQIAIGEVLDRTKIESMGQPDPIDIPIEEKPERRRGAKRTPEDEPIEHIETEKSIEPIEERQPARGRGSRKRQSETREEHPIEVLPDPFLPTASTPIEKLDVTKDPNSLYTQFVDESITSMTDAAAKDAAAIVSGSSSVSIEQVLKEQKHSSQNSTTTVVTTNVAPIFPRGVLPGVSMNQ